MFDMIMENTFLHTLMVFLVGFILSVIALWIKNQSEHKLRQEESTGDQE